MALASKWIEAIHTRLLVRYGSKWVAMWTGIDGELVKEDWAQQLDGLWPDAIRRALEQLPEDWPPNAAQFRSLAIGPPEAGSYKALPSPPADPEKVAAVIEQLSRIPRLRDSDPKAWEHRLREREKQGDRLTKAQRDMWRAAIGMEGQPA